MNTFKESLIMIISAFYLRLVLCKKTFLLLQAGFKYGVDNVDSKKQLYSIYTYIFLRMHAQVYFGVIYHHIVSCNHLSDFRVVSL